MGNIDNGPFYGNDWADDSEEHFDEESGIPSSELYRTRNNNQHVDSKTSLFASLGLAALIGWGMYQIYTKQDTIDEKDQIIRALDSEIDSLIIDSNARLSKLLADQQVSDYEVRLLRERIQTLERRLQEEREQVLSLLPTSK